MKTLEQAARDAILRTDFDSFLRRCLMTLNPGSQISPELAHNGDGASARSRSPR